MKKVQIGVMAAALATGGLLAVSASAGGMGGMDSHRGADRSKAIDADGNGTLARAEVAAFERANAAAFDLDGNGAVTAAEMKAFREARRARHEAERMVKLDTNKDGRVAVEEIAAARVEWTMKRDADGNGVLSADEMSYRGQRGKHGHR